MNRRILNGRTFLPRWRCRAGAFLTAISANCQTICLVLRHPHHRNEPAYRRHDGYEVAGRPSRAAWITANCLPIRVWSIWPMLPHGPIGAELGKENGYRANGAGPSVIAPTGTNRSVWIATPKGIRADLPAGENSRNWAWRLLQDQINHSVACRWKSLGYGSAHNRGIVSMRRSTGKHRQRNRANQYTTQPGRPHGLRPARDRKGGILCWLSGL